MNDHLKIFCFGGKAATIFDISLFSAEAKSITI
jgi:hypothetical protein